MKKTIASLITAGLATISGFAYAADNAVTPIESGIYVENDATGCSILRDRVTVNTSSGVTMVYNCLVAANKVNLGSCHSAGSQKPTPIRCQVTGTDDDENPVYNDPSCTAQWTEANPVTFEIAGRRGFTASTTGGSVATASLNATTCTEAALGALPGVAQ